MDSGLASVSPQRPGCDLGKARMAAGPHGACALRWGVEDALESAEHNASLTHAMGGE